MILFGTQKINKKNHLEIGGCDTVDLVKEFGTPLYVLDEELIRLNCRNYSESFKKFYPKSEIIYAGKANLCLSICTIIKEEGLSLDVSSGGELYTAIKADFPRDKIFFHGNNKSYEELKESLEVNIGTIVVDNEYELDLIEHLAKDLNKKINILIRITPGVKPKTHSYIQTGQIDSKFGSNIENGSAFKIIEKTFNLENINLCGLHCHIGSQIFDLKSFEIAAEIMINFFKEIKDKLGKEINELNLGGGLGIRYTEEDFPPKISELAEIISKRIKEKCSEHYLKLPKLMVEPGRSIVGEAGTTLYTIGSIKNILGIRKYIAVDGGMADNPRPALYNAKYKAILANKAGDKNEEIVSIVGKCCESGDVLIWDIKLPKIESGDILAVFSTGAYCYSMASNYNRLPRPATVLVKDKKAKLIVRRENYDDIIKCDVL